jgi:hypothetical protein
MTTTKLVATLLVGVLSQISAGLPIRIGPTGSEVSDADVVAIRQVLGETVRPWIVVGLAPGWIKGRFVDVYVQPDVTVDGIRRGRLESLGTASVTLASNEQRGEWRQVSSARWAQVPNDGADLDFIAGSRDLNRPFMVLGELTDGDLMTLVKFIRSSPKAPDNSRQPIGKDHSQVQGTWPIVQVAVTGSAVRVRLIDESPREKSGQMVTVGRIDNTWVIQQLGYWIAD